MGIFFSEMNVSNVICTVTVEVVCPFSLNLSKPGFHFKTFFQKKEVSLNIVFAAAIALVVASKKCTVC